MTFIDEIALVCLIKVSEFVTMVRLRVGTPRTHITPVYFGVMLIHHHSCAPYLVYFITFVSRFSHFSLNRVSEIFCAPASL